MQTKKFTELLEALGNNESRAEDIEGGGSGDPYQNLIDEISADKPSPEKTAQVLADEFDPAQHKVLKVEHRPDKEITTDTGESSQAVNRIPVSMQEKIVNMAVAFLLGKPIQHELVASDDEAKKRGEPLYKVLQKIYFKNKMNYLDSEIFRRLCSEGEVAEIWYAKEIDKDDNYWAGTVNEKVITKTGKQVKYKIFIASHSNGYTLYPVFDEYGDKIGFGMAYEAGDGDEAMSYFDLFTANTDYTGVKKKDEDKWSVTTKPNPVKKIRVIYHKKARVEWFVVQWAIERLEELISNHADINDYNGSPMVVIKGKLISFAKKGERGKIIEIQGDAGDARYMSWDSAPESIRMEAENLIDIIFDQSDTPNISFESLKALGHFSEFAAKMLFMQPHLKAARNEAIYGIGVQRRNNFLMAASAIMNADLKNALDVEIVPKFEYFLPKDDREAVEVLTMAVAGKILSRKSGIEKNPLVKDVKAEQDQIKTEDDEALEREKELSEGDII